MLNKIMPPPHTRHNPVCTASLDMLVLEPSYVWARSSEPACCICLWPDTFHTGIVCINTCGRGANAGPDVDGTMVLCILVTWGSVRGNGTAFRLLSFPLSSGTGSLFSAGSAHLGHAAWWLHLQQTMLTDILNLKLLLQDHHPQNANAFT